MNKQQTPEGWKVEILGNLGYTFNGLTGKTKDDFGQGRPFIPYMNIFANSKVDKNFMAYVSIGPDESQSKVEYGDILLTTSSETPEEVGMSSVVLDELPETYLNSFSFGFRLYNFDSLLPEYGRYLFRSEEVRKILSILSQGSTRFNLSKTALLRKLHLLLPPLAEQQKIAEILSTVDEKMAVIDEQLAQTQELKKGLMQRLLTRGIGHVTFKNSPVGEIPENWEVKNLNEVSNVVRGASPRPAGSPLYFGGDFLPWITVGALTNHVGIFLTKKNVQSFLTEKGAEHTRIIQPDTVLLSNSGATLGVPKILTFVAGANDGIAAFLNLKGVSKRFLYYFLQSKTNYFRNELAPGSGQPNLNTSLIGSLKFPIPPISEQHQIAEILTAVDDKLQVLTDKRAQYQELKRGLMQQLLTGQRRVKVAQEDAVLA